MMQYIFVIGKKTRTEDILKLEDVNKQGEHTGDEERPRDSTKESRNILLSKQTIPKSMPLTVTNLLNFDKTTGKMLVKVYSSNGDWRNEGNQFSPKSNNHNADEQIKKSLVEIQSEYDVIQEVTKANVKDMFQLASEKSDLGAMNYGAESRATNITTKLGLSLTKPYHSTVEVCSATKTEGSIYQDSGDLPEIKSYTENKADDASISEYVFPIIKNVHEIVSSSELLNSRRALPQRLQDPKNDRKIVRKKRVKNERKGIFLPPVKQRSDRSEELNQMSSIQVGKTKCSYYHRVGF